MEEIAAANIEAWDACEMFGDDLQELVEFLDYQEFYTEPFSTNGQNTGGIRMCYANVTYLEDSEYASSDLRGSITFGFGTASQETDIYAPEEYRTPTGRYDQFLQIRRELYDPETLAELTEEGPWTEATILLGDTGTGTDLSAFIVDVERDFMMDLSVDLGSRLNREGFGDQLTWTIEDAAQHFREVTVPNAYQGMADRIDEVS